jgi:radical SAM superfamily enzyme YgiQ (UPF0313 family)
MAVTKRVMLVQPRSTGGNFEYVAIPRQGMLFLSGALAQWSERADAPFRYERCIWFEDRSGKIDPVTDLHDYDVLLVTALVNETPRAYEIARAAKLAHPNLVVIGGGPQMGPLPEEAMYHGLVDVVVQREGEDIIGPLLDVLLSTRRADWANELRKLDGIAFKDDMGAVIQRPFRRMIPSDYVELPDYGSLRDLTPANPMAAGVLETARGCTESCTYCEVIQQFVGYRMVKPETELKRIAQLQELAANGLIYRSPRDGRFATFISDDLHAPPSRARKFRNDRLARAQNWKGHTEGMFFISQNRAELGSDPELAEAFQEIGMGMLYIGVESSSAENLAAVKKRQEPDQMHKDLEALQRMGFDVVAMTIIGLPYDDEAQVMQLAEWVRGVSKFQTANLLTPLPATVNWPNPLTGTGLKLLNRDGDLLNGDGSYNPMGELPPYELFTGRQFVHQDDALIRGQPRNWTLQESRAVMNRYLARLRPVDKLYERIFDMMRRRKDRLEREAREQVAIPVRV